MPDGNKCPYCRKILETRTLFIQHIMSEHRAKVSLTPPPSPPSEPSMNLLLQYVKEKFPPSPGPSSAPDPPPHTPLTSSELTNLRVKTLELIFRNPSDFVTFTSEHVHDHSNRFKLFGKSFNLILSSLGKEAAKIGTTLALLDSLLNYLLDKMKKIHVGPNPFYVSFRIIQNDILSPPICTPYLRVDEISTHAQLLSQVSMVSVSKPALLADAELTIELSCLGIEENVESVTFGSRLKRSQFATDLDFAHSKKGVIDVPNLLWGNDCLLVGIVLGLQILKSKNVKKITDREMFRKPKYSAKLKSLAILFSNDCYPSINWNNPQNLNSCTIVQSNLNENFNVQLIIHDHVLNHRSLFYRGTPHRDKNQQLHLLLLNEHIFILRDFEKFYQISMCHICKRSFKIGSHKICRGNGRLCLKCRTSECFKTSRNLGKSEVSFEAQMCTACNAFFPNQFCFSQHKNAPLNAIAKVPVCRHYYHCIECGWRIERMDPNSNQCEPKKPHNCLEAYCRLCKVHWDCSSGQRHFCTIGRPSLRELGVAKAWLDKREQLAGYALAQFEPIENMYSKIVGENSGIVIYDIETRLAKSGKLIPYLLTACFACSKCCFTDFMSPDSYKESYDCCGQRFRNYIGTEQIKDFILDIFFKKRHTKMTGFAHNARNFDALFILDILIENGVIPKIQLKGRQLLKLSLNGTVLKDYNCFVQGALSRIPGNFGFAHLTVKGAFPHKLANLVDNDYCSENWPGKEL